MAQEDIPLLVNWIVETPLWQRYGLQPEQTTAEFQRAIHQQHILLVVDLAPSSYACGFSWCMPTGAFGLSAYLRLIGVQQEHTGSGMGTLLLAATERRAAQTAKDMFLLVSDFNVDAQRFYRRSGYQQIGAVPGYVLSDVTELIYWKRLHD